MDFSKRLAHVIFFICLLGAFPLCAKPEEQPEFASKKILFFSVPKSGTHLLSKLLWKMTNRSVEWLAPCYYGDPKPDPESLDPNDRGIYLHHLFSSFDTIKDDHSGKYIKILLIRDPRDTLVSQVEWTGSCKGCWWWAPNKFNDMFVNLPRKQKYMTAIHYPEEKEHYGLKYFFRKALEWMEDPEVLVLRFEELVGPEGGGDAEVQKNAIRKLAAHIGYTVTEEDVDWLAEHVFGGTATFNKGQIGTWRENFTPDITKQFKNQMGQLLIDLGYEKDNNWKVR